MRDGECVDTCEQMCVPMRACVRVSVRTRAKVHDCECVDMCVQMCVPVRACVRVCALVQKCTIVNV